MTYNAHRSRFRVARAAARLARVEDAVLVKRWTQTRSLRLDLALVRFERTRDRTRRAA